MSTTFRLAELTGVAPGRYRLDTAAGSTSPAADLSLTEPLLLLRQGQLPAPVKSSTGRPVLYAKRLGLGDRVLATVMLAADSQAPAGAPGGTGGATLQALADLDAAKAPLASPAFTGTPTAPTAAAGTNTTQVATTAFTRGEVAALVASAPGTLDTLGEIAAALASDESAATALAATVAGKAPLASPVFTGNPTAPTPTAGDNDTSIATTAFVKTAVGSSVASVRGAWTASGMVLAVADVVVYKGVRYETKTAHTTGATFDYSKFIRAASNSLLGKGFCVPAGSLDTALTDLALHGSKLVEWVGFGDSLMNGQVNGGNVYSWWANRVRERLVTGLGITDGGRGYNWTGAATSGIDNFGTEPTPVSAVTGFAANDLFGIAGMAISATANDAITFKAVGTRCRLWWSRFSQGGRFSYTVNGGAAVTVNSGYNDAPQIPAASGQSWSPDNSVLLTSADGLTSGTNTIVVTNLGGALTTAPVMTAVNNATGTLPAATYYYVATTVTSNGETTPGNAMSRVTSANQGNNTVFAIGQGGLTVRIYRSTTGAAGSYQLIGSTTGNSNGVWGFTDNGSATPGAAPPTVDTSGLDNLNKTVHVTVEPINATGLVLHNQGVSGTDTYTLFDVNAQDNNIPALALMGLQWGTGANGLAQYLPSEQLPSANNSGTDTPLVRSKARKPSLVVFAFGTNDIQHADNSLVTAPNAPSATDGGVGVGSGLAAATYYYKVARVVPNQFGGYGPISAASSGTAVTAGHQALVTMPSPGNSPGAAIWAVFRSTSSGGTYAYVGESVGHGSVFIDNITTPGAAYGATGLVQPTVDTSRTENALALGIRMARNAGADVLVVLPSIESLQNSRHIGAIYKAAILRVAQSYSCAWVDWDIALGPQAARGAAGYGGGSANPHLTKAAYQAQGDFLVDNILLPLYQTA